MNDCERELMSTYGLYNEEPERDKIKIISYVRDDFELLIFNIKHAKHINDQLRISQKF